MHVLHDALRPLRLQQRIKRMLHAQRITERPPLEPTLDRRRPARVGSLDFEGESVNQVVEEVRLADCYAAEGEVGEMDLRGRG